MDLAGSLILLRCVGSYTGNILLTSQSAVLSECFQHQFRLVRQVVGAYKYKGTLLIS